MHVLQGKLEKTEGKPPGVHKAEAVAPPRPAHRHLSDPMPAKKGGLSCTALLGPTSCECNPLRPSACREWWAQLHTIYTY